MRYLLILLLTACAQVPVADTGLALDGATTAIGIASGKLSEANPIRPDGAVGNIVFTAGVIGVRHLVKKYDNKDCVIVTKAMSTAGWAGASNNLVQLLGFGTPIGIVTAIFTGFIAWQKDYKAECK